MSLSTHFQHTETTILPLPHPKTGESWDSVRHRGINVALSLLQDHDYMMDLSPLHTGHEELPASSDQAIQVETLAAEFNVLLSSTPGQQRVNGGAEWRHYEVHDQVPLVMGYKKDITFQTAMRKTETGMESLTDPGNTVRIHGRYDVCKSQDDLATLTLVERTTTHCNLVLGLYIKSNLSSSHADIHKTIKARFVEEMQKPQ